MPINTGLGERHVQPLHGFGFARPMSSCNHVSGICLINRRLRTVDFGFPGRPKSRHHFHHPVPWPSTATIVIQLILDQPWPYYQSAAQAGLVGDWGIPRRVTVMRSTWPAITSLLFPEHHGKVLRCLPGCQPCKDTHVRKSEDPSACASTWSVTLLINALAQYCSPKYSHL